MHKLSCINTSAAQHADFNCGRICQLLALQDTSCELKQLALPSSVTPVWVSGGVQIPVKVRPGSFIAAMVSMISGVGLECPQGSSIPSLNVHVNRLCLHITCQVLCTPTATWHGSRLRPGSGSWP